MYAALSMSPQAMAGAATEVVPWWAKVLGAAVLLALSVKPVFQKLRQRFGRKDATAGQPVCGCSSEPAKEGDSCGCAEPTKGSAVEHADSGCSAGAKAGSGSTTDGSGGHDHGHG